jgi:hypothetical protein
MGIRTHIIQSRYFKSIHLESQEKSWNREWGAEERLTHSLRFEIALFHKSGG